MNQVATKKESNLPAINLGVSKTAIAKLKKKYPAENVPDAGSKDGMTEIKGVLRELVPLRTGVEKKRIELVADAVAWQKSVNAEAGELKKAIAGIEKPYRDAKTTEEERVEREKREKEEAEERRIADIEGKIEDIQRMGEGLLGADINVLEEIKAGADSIKITDEEYMEFVEPASIMLGQVKQSLDMAITTARQVEEQKEQMRKQQEAFDKQKAVIEQQQAEINRQQREVDAANAKARAAEENAQRERQEQAERKRQEEERQEREAKAEKERIEAERLEAEEAERREAELKARMPEDLKMRELADRLIGVDLPDVESEAMIDLLDDAMNIVKSAADMIYKNTQAPK